MIWPCRSFTGNSRGLPGNRPTSLFPPSFCETPPSSQKSSSTSASSSTTTNDIGSDGIGSGNNPHPRYKWKQHRYSHLDYIFASP